MRDRVTFAILAAAMCGLLSMDVFGQSRRCPVCEPPSASRLNSTVEVRGSSTLDSANSRNLNDSSRGVDDIRGSSANGTPRSTSQPNLSNLNQNHGLPIAGSPDSLQKSGFTVQPARGTGPERAVVVESPNGSRRLFVDPSNRNYRSIAEKNGLNTKGVDIDHAAARNANPRQDMTLLSSSNPQVNRSHGAAERKANPPPSTGGVTYAGPQQIRKLNGHPPVNTSRDGLSKTMNGVSPDPNVALSKSAEVPNPS